MEDLRENMQLEKLRALKPIADLGDLATPQRKLGLTSTKMDPKAMGKELQDEVFQYSFTFKDMPVSALYRAFVQLWLTCPQTTTKNHMHSTTTTIIPGG